MSMKSMDAQYLDMVGVLGSIPSVPTTIGQGLASESDPPEIDAEGQAEFDAIASMITEATKHSLQVEVVHSFGVYRMSGYDVLTSCREALYEWDI